MFEQFLCFISTVRGCFSDLNHGGLQTANSRRGKQDPSPFGLRLPILWPRVVFLFPLFVKTIFTYKNTYSFYFTQQDFTELNMPKFIENERSAASKHDLNKRVRIFYRILEERLIESFEYSN